MKYTILGYKQTGTIRKKLLTMGLTTNVTIEVIRVAPLGDPIEIKVRGYMLTLRKTEFDLLILQPINCTGCTKCEK
jgi:ferrous iron transport protein A